MAIRGRGALATAMLSFLALSCQVLLGVPDSDFVVDDSGAPTTDVRVEDAPAADAGIDAPSPPCDLTKPFQSPALLPGFPVDLHAATPRLSPDELTIYFTTQVAGRGAELGTASRGTRTDPFGPVTTLVALTTTSNDNNPSISADGLALFFHSDQAGSIDLYVAARPTTAEPFGAAMPIASLNTPGSESQIFYRASGQEAWFVSPKAGTTDIYVAKRRPEPGFVFDAPDLVPELSSAAEDWAPLPSEDGLSIVFTSNRGGNFDLYTAKRATTQVPFEPPMPIAELSSPSIDYGGWVSRDGCRIYFSSTRDTPGDSMQRAFIAERPR